MSDESTRQNLQMPILSDDVREEITELSRRLRTGDIFSEDLRQAIKQLNSDLSDLGENDER